MGAPAPADAKADVKPSGPAARLEAHNAKKKSKDMRKHKTPGPGAYEPGKAAEKKVRVAKAISHSPFRSGSRRALPWGGTGANAPSSTRAACCCA